MKRIVMILLLVLLPITIFGCGEGEEKVTTDLKVLPFELTRDAIITISIKGEGSIETDIESSEAGVAFVEVFNENISKLELKKDTPNVVVRMDDNKEVHVNYGFSIVFIDDDNETTYYFFSEVPDDFNAVYNQLLDFLREELDIDGCSLNPAEAGMLASAVRYR